MVTKFQAGQTPINKIAKDRKQHKSNLLRPSSIGPPCVGGEGLYQPRQGGRRRRGGGIKEGRVDAKADRRPKPVNTLKPVA